MKTVVDDCPFLPPSDAANPDDRSTDHTCWFSVVPPCIDNPNAEAADHAAERRGAPVACHDLLTASAQSS